MDGLVSPIKPSRLRIIERLGMYPLDSRFMPPPGPDFLRVANGLAEESFYRVSTRKVKGKTVKDVNYHFSEMLNQLYLRALREPGFQMQIEVKRGVYKEAMFVPGHIWSENWDSYMASTDPNVLPKPVTGPAPADVLVLGKMPWKEELTAGRNFVSTAGKELLEAISGAHIKGSRNWYVTNLVKFMPPDETTTLKASWVADCLPLLAQELRIVRPKFILCLGADACRYLLKAASHLGRLTDGMKKFSVGYLEGRTIKFEYYIGDDDDSDTWQPAKVVVTAHPAAVVHDDSAKRQLQRGITRFGFVTSGKEAELNEDDLDHRVCETLEEAELLLQEANVYLATSRLKFVAWDAEWQGQHPCNEGSYIRTVQMSWKSRQGVCFKLRHAGGAVSFVDEDGVDAIDRLMAALTEFMKGKRAVGHFLVADLEWLQHAGFDLLPSFVVPTEPDADGNPAWYRCQQGEGGFDTAMACHAIEETSFLGLEILTMRYTVAPRYDIPLEDWKVAYCKQRNIKPAALEGYGDCPDEILIPYSCLHGDSLVQRADGEWEKIRDLVRRRYAGKVKALLNGKVVDATVTNWHRRDVGQREWFRLRTSSSSYGRHGLLGPIFTPDHEVLTQRGKVRVDQIVSGEDFVATEERTFSADQLSVFLGSILGDGGYLRKNGRGTGFGFGQAAKRVDYADWKACVFASFEPVRHFVRGGVRYSLPFSRYISSLLHQFPTQAPEVHNKRKAVITDELLLNLGVVGLAVWYQDDGCLVRDKRDGRLTARIYCKITPEEQVRVVAWLSNLLGVGVTYNKKARFVQITRGAFDSLVSLIADYVHPVFTYKLPPGTRMGDRLHDLDVEGSLFYERIEEVVPWVYDGSRSGNGVRYCLTVEGAGNFLTKVGFVSNCYDADVSLRIAYVLEELLSCDYFEQNAWEAFWESMLTQPVILEIHQTGISVDRRRIDKLTKDFLAARNATEKEIKEEAEWPELNLRSTPQIREYLFGEELNRVIPDKESEKFKRLRPPGAKSLGIMPLVNTDKRPKRWVDLVAAGVSDEHSPSTSKSTLAILAQDNPDEEKKINRLRDHRFLDQVLKSVLRPPLTDKDGVYLVDDDNGCWQYDKGLAACINDDGRVRPNLRPTAETGRWKCARPNLQNLSKARDPDYERLLGKEEDGSSKYKHKIRSMLCSPSAVVQSFRETWGKLKTKKIRRKLLETYQPILGLTSEFIQAFMKDDGIFVPGQDEVFVDFDFKGAELYGMAIMSGDLTMIEHAQRNILYADEGYDADGKECAGGKFAHPQYFDIHSNVAVMAFRLTVPDGEITNEKVAKKLGIPSGMTFSEFLKLPVGAPLPATKNALVLIEKSHLRIVAKSVIFGVAYGRAAKAIALAVREQKVEISENEAQQVIDALFAQYTKLKPYFEACCARATQVRWLCNCYGRFRRFPEVEDSKAAGEFERQSMNYPIQSSIASSLNRGVSALYSEREAMYLEFGEKPFLFCLTIHDAVLIQAKAKYVDRLINGGVIKRAMCETHPIYPADLAGMPLKGGPYYLGLDFEVSEYWSEPLSESRSIELGVPTKFA